MDLHLTSEQILLRDSAAKFIAAAGPKVARGFRQGDPGFAPERLRQAGDLGWLGMLVPPSAGGLGLGLTELALVLEQAGRGLVCEPLGLAAIAAAALAQGYAPHPMLKKAMTGAALVVPALQESAHGDDLLEPRTQAAEADGSPRLTGTKTFVCADGATAFWSTPAGETERRCTMWPIMLSAAVCRRRRRRTAASLQPSTLRMRPPISSLRDSRRAVRSKRSPILRSSPCRPNCLA